MSDTNNEEPVREPVSICFLGGLFDRTKVHEIERASRGIVQNAANALQWNIVDGLEEAQSEVVTIITAPFVGAFPKLYRSPLVKRWPFEHVAGASDISVGFLNLPVIKHFCRARSMKKALESWLRRTPGRKAIIAYSLSYSVIRAVVHAKLIDKEAVACVVVPDLPEYMNTTAWEGRAYRFLKRLEIKSIHVGLRAVDCMVLLTEAMSERLPTSAPFIVMEGIASDIAQATLQSNPRQRTTLTYAGTLNARYGIVNLLQAFSSIDDPDIFLQICGRGDSEDQVIAYANNDSRITYYGQLSRVEVLELLINSTVLLNPRSNDEDFAQYSFPSKILEYMSAGRPVIAYELDGMPREYGDYLIYVSESGVAPLADRIVEVSRRSDEELNAIGARARKFVLEHKNPLAQAQRILGLIDLVGTGRP